MSNDAHNEEQPRPPDHLTPELINMWSSGYRSATERIIQLAENEVGHSLPWTRQIVASIEPQPEPEPDPPSDT